MVWCSMVWDGMIWLWYGYGVVWYDFLSFVDCHSTYTVCAVVRPGVHRSIAVCSLLALSPLFWYYNAIQYHTIQYHTIQYSAIQYNTIQSIQYHTIQLLTPSPFIPIQYALHYTSLLLHPYLSNHLHATNLFPNTLCIVWYCIVWYCIALYCIVWCICIIVLYCIALYGTVLYWIVLYCTELYCMVRYCMVGDVDLYQSSFASALLGQSRDVRHVLQFAFDLALVP